MPKRVLITGGAGFIGSHLADELLEHGWTVRVLDCLSSQVHSNGGRPDYLSREVELMIGDVRDRRAVQKALQGVDAVFHLAAKVGVGQSMYQVEEYTAVNGIGTAILMEEVVEMRVARLVVASSMSIYGEGLYRDSGGQMQTVSERPLEQLRQRQWEVLGATGDVLQPMPTPETKTPSLASVYALGKYDQERMCLMLGRAYGISTTALRFFNVYGPRQALSNPYTGVLAIFASQMLTGKPPMLFEDGLQKRDFVHVRDVAQACRLALENPEADQQVLNVGSGRSISVIEVAEELAKVLGRTDVEPEITGRYRVGDIRHCFADITKAKQILGYRPQVSFSDGLAELSEWLHGQAPVSHVSEARRELQLRGLTV